ncbi:hypothetical protein O0L34_g6565 [Tuta absoluta]|nr:hypothetical protein O0L34_g6565 [Tuta absoluta]
MPSNKKSSSAEASSTCDKCKVKITRNRGLLCIKCNKYYCQECTNTEKLFYLLKNKQSWKCRTCVKETPNKDLEYPNSNRNSPSNENTNEGYTQTNRRFCAQQESEKVNESNITLPNNTSTPEPPQAVSVFLEVQSGEEVVLEPVIPSTSASSGCDINKDCPKPDVSSSAAPIVDNVTKRTLFRSNVTTSNSFELLLVDEENSLETQKGEFQNINRSCPEIGKSNNIQEELKEKKLLIIDLEYKLENYDKLFNKYLLENSELKKRICLYEQKINSLNNICASSSRKNSTCSNLKITPQRERLDLELLKRNLEEQEFSASVKKSLQRCSKKPQNLDYNTQLSSLINKITELQKQLTNTLQDLKQLQYNKKDELNNIEKSFEEQYSGYKGNITSSDIPEMRHSLINDPKDVGTCHICKSELASAKVNNDKKVEDFRHRVLILADENGKGMNNKLRTLLGNDFFVVSFVKNNATLDQVLSDSVALCKDFTKEDYLIIVAGSNDKDPMKLQLDLYKYLYLLQHTNVLVGEVYRNNNVTEIKLNQVYKLICSYFDNVRLLKVTGNANNIHRIDRISLCKEMLRDIINIQYKNNFIDYKKKTALFLKENGRTVTNISTQTDETHCFFRD